MNTEIFFVYKGIFLKCRLGQAIRNEVFDIPPPKALPDSDVMSPFVILGDEAFPLMENLMKPYARQQSLVDRTKAIFNYRLSRARRIVENSFGILAQHFHVFHTPINVNIDTIENLVTSTCILHNLICIESKGASMEDAGTPSSKMDSLEEFNESLEPNGGNPQQVRDNFKDYLNGVGAVSWQNETIRL